MQATFQNQQHKHIFFSGPKGIKTELEDNAMLKIKNEKFLFSEEKDDYIGQLILDQNRLPNGILTRNRISKEMYLRSLIIIVLMQFLTY